MLRPAGRGGEGTQQRAEQFPAGAGPGDTHETTTPTGDVRPGPFRGGPPQYM
ncbi:hypothetical protein A176_000549 [Myxococcus hansupus]|uniref:Uncharacterized protein n=1 Tax=Pseudomyxococcus hansupus TaxID=1297742 RepID=A0A0H4X6Z8_9BACT|nr:hypothetical protein A176_000549 [Myxococcus hansupus]